MWERVSNSALVQLSTACGLGGTSSVQPDSLRGCAGWDALGQAEGGGAQSLGARRCVCTRLLASPLWSHSCPQAAGPHTAQSGPALSGQPLLVEPQADLIPNCWRFSWLHAWHEGQCHRHSVGSRSSAALPVCRVRNAHDAHDACASGSHALQRCRPLPQCWPAKSRVPRSMLMLNGHPAKISSHQVPRLSVRKASSMHQVQHRGQRPALLSVHRGLQPKQAPQRLLLRLHQHPDRGRPRGEFVAQTASLQTRARLPAAQPGAAAQRRAAE